MIRITIRTTAVRDLPALDAPQPAYLRTIDGLRGIAIALVLFNHSTQLFHKAGSETHPFWRFTPGGWIGVDLFFVVSGFLVTKILLAERGAAGAFRAFWLRRALRIFPLACLYLLTLAGLWAAGRFPTLASPWQLLWAATYTSNFYIAAWGWMAPALSMLWSLAVEEQFYTLWPLIALSVRTRTLGWILVAVILTAPVLRVFTSLYLGTAATYVLLFSRWDCLAWGALLAFLWASPWRERVVRRARQLLLPSLAVPAVVFWVPLGPAAHSPFLFEVAGYSAIAAACFVWTATALAPGPLVRRFLSAGWLTYAGRLCYGLYIWHVLGAEAVQMLARKLGAPWTFERQILLWLILLLCVATVSHRFFEAPILALKSRIRRSERSTAGGKQDEPRPDDGELPAHPSRPPSREPQPG